nr:hypothetical protein [Breznakibacter sp.]
MAFYQFTRAQKLPTTLHEVWHFISSPANLKEITPPAMDFTITGNSGEGKMYPGMIITYRVRPLWGIKMDWM